jgi:predicted lysophospholipase L1 biosynthesis ABC-type transport system permease subunit
VGRRRELAVRHALGAGRGLIVRQFIAESLVLLSASCAGGLLIASLGIRALLSLAPGDLPRLDDVTLNRGVLAFAMAVSALVAVTLGVVTALRATRGEPRDVLIDHARGQAGAAGSQRVSRAIVAAQLAITLVLLIGAALLGRSLLRVLSVDPGFRTDRIMAMDLANPYSDGPEAKARLIPFYADAFDRLRAIPA